MLRVNNCYGSTFDLDFDLSDHRNNARNEFLRSYLYEKMVLRMNVALLLKKLLFAFYWGGHVGF